MSRETMEPLISRLRLLIGDPAGASGGPAFTDDELEAFLDERSTDVGRSALRAVPTATESATVFAAPYRWWEAATLTDEAGAEVEGATADLLAGRWEFASAVSGPVYVAGRRYDLYGTAAVVCEAWAARLARDFDFAADGQRFTRSQKSGALLRIAETYWSRAVPPGRSSW